MTLHHTFDEIDAKYKHAITKRDPHQAEIAETYSLVMPSKDFQNLSDNNPMKVIKKDIMDSTALKGVRNLKSQITNLLIPASRPWQNIKWFDDVAEERLETLYGAKLEAANKKVFLHFASGSFRSATSVSIDDWTIAGQACVLTVDEPGTPIHYLPVPISEVVFLEDAEGNITSVFRVHYLSRDQLIERFGKEKLPDDVVKKAKANNEKEWKLLESYVPIENGYEYQVFIYDLEEEITNATSLWNAFTIYRWERSIGNVWAESITRNALPHIRAVNRMKEDYLIGADFAAKGAFQTKNESMNTQGNKGKVVAGVLLLTRELIVPIEFPGNLAVNIDAIEREQAAIRDILLDFSLPQQTSEFRYIVAEAFIQQRENFMSLIGEPSIALQQEFLLPMADQTVGRMIERGDIVIASPEELVAAGYEAGTTLKDVIKVDVNAAVQQITNINQATTDLRAWQMVAQTLGPQVASRHVVTDNFAHDLFENLGFSPANLRSLKQLAKLDKEAERDEEALINLVGSALSSDPTARGLQQALETNVPTPGQ